MIRFLFIQLIVLTLLHHSRYTLCTEMVASNQVANIFENWDQNIQYTLLLDPNFAPFLIKGC